jgi:3-hydroxy-9,10-secoandrosta-1,3,5(10)-triene-9,17-dione monooxygenase
VHVRIDGAHADGPPDGTLCWAVVPRDQYEILWDWGNFADLGLQASGSNTVVIENARIPKQWLVVDNFRNIDYTQGTPGARLHGNPMYLGNHADMYHAGLVAPQIGAVRGALDEYEQIMRTTRNWMPPQVLQMEDRSHQTAYGLATELCDAAEMILIHSAEMHHEYQQRWAETGQPFTPEEETRLYGALQQSGRLAWRAMEQIWTNAPVDAAKAGAVIQRCYRDLSMYRLHVSARPLNLSPRIAQLHFGITAEPPPPSG